MSEDFIPDCVITAVRRLFQMFVPGSVIPVTDRECDGEMKNLVFSSDCLFFQFGIGKDSLLGISVKSLNITSRPGHMKLLW